MNKLAEAFRLARSIKAAGPRKFTQHMVPHVVRPAQIIWNKALGGIFVFLGAFFLVAAWNYHRGTSPMGMILAGFMGMVMIAFGLASFMKARRLSRL